MKKIAGSDSRIALIDAHAIFRDCDNEALFADHVHPNEKGQALVARIAAQAVAARRSGACAGIGCAMPETQAVCGD